jgi:hypothetical protein
MNYLEIVLQGYFNDNNREFLEKYFFREFKKAEKEQFFEAVEFFNGCLKVIEGWEKHLQDKVFERKRELYSVLNAARNGTLSYAEFEGKTIEEKWQETIQYCEQELKDVRPDGIGSLSFTVHLHSLTNGRIAYNMAYSEVLQIKLSILIAFKKTQPNNEPLPPQPIVKQKPEQETPKTFDELFYNTDLVKPCIDILKELDPPLIDTDCNYIGKLKGVFCVWIDEMQRQGIVKHYSDRKIFASLIQQKIKRFSIDESMFGKYQSKAENLYRTDIKTKVSKIKLSQNSH